MQSNQTMQLACIANKHGNELWPCSTSMTTSAKMNRLVVLFNLHSAIHGMIPFKILSWKTKDIEIMILSALRTQLLQAPTGAPNSP